MVEQLTFNQLAVGSIPTPLTNTFNDLGYRLTGDFPACLSPIFHDERFRGRMLLSRPVTRGSSSRRTNFHRPRIDILATIMDVMVVHPRDPLRIRPMLRNQIIHQCLDFLTSHGQARLDHVEQQAESE